MLENFINRTDDWMQASQSNYGLYFVIIAMTVVAGFAISWLFNKKIGKSDERSDYIKMRIGYVTLGIGLVITLIFMPSIADTSVKYGSQLVLIPLAITMLANAVISAYYYNQNK